MYIKVTDGNGVVYSLQKLREDNPDQIFPANMSNEFLAQWDVYPVSVPDAPQADFMVEYLSQGPFYEANGSWTFDWVKSQVPQDVAERNIRNQRNQLLSNCDWTQLADTPTDSAPWAIYRQELRDLPQQAGFPYSVVWPTEPTS